MATHSTDRIQIIRRKELERKTGLSRSTIYAAIQAGTFPAPIKLGGRAVGWVETEIEAWLQEQVAKSRMARSVRQ